MASNVNSPMETPSSVSRSGRVRKKTAKVLEMEELSETPVPIISPAAPVLSRIEDDFDKPLKKKLKIKLSPSGNSVQETLCEDSLIKKEKIEPVPKPVSSLKIKIRTGPSGSEVCSSTIPTTPITTSTPKIEPDDTGLPKLVINFDPPKHKSGEHKPKSSNSNASIKNTVENESPANKLFKQITRSPHVNNTVIAKKSGTNSSPSPAPVRDNLNLASADGDDKNESSDSSYEEEEEEEDASDSSNSDSTPWSATTNSSSADRNKSTIKPLKRTQTKLEKLVKVVNRRGPRMKIGTGKPNTAAKEAKKRSLSAYTLFARENRQRIMQKCSELDFASVSKKLGEIWQSLPGKEKNQWKRKAIQLSESTNNGYAGPVKSGPKTNITRNTIAAAYPYHHSRQIIKSNTKPINVEPRPIGTGPMDVACHLKLLGDHLTNLGNNLTYAMGNRSKPDFLSNLLDSALCAIGPLLCLTNQSEQGRGSAPETHLKILDNISYIMPGL